MKYITVLSIIVWAGMLIPVAAFAADVEVALKDGLDGNLNSYCLDIKGGGRNVDPEEEIILGNDSEFLADMMRGSSRLFADDTLYKQLLPNLAIGIDEGLTSKKGKDS